VNRRAGYPGVEGELPAAGLRQHGGPGKRVKGEDRAFKPGLFVLVVSALRLILGSGLF
jgi:hypothetical protein